MEIHCALVKYFLHFINLYPATSQAPRNLELSTCLKQCMESGSCLSVFYDKSEKKCLHIEVFLMANDLSLSEKQGTFYYGQDRAPLEKECASSPGYQLESGMCLKQSNITETWPAANRSCENDGASLLKIGSREKDNALKPLFTPEYQWAGGNDLATEGSYVWTDGTAIQGFTNWYGKNPDGGTRENCMMITADVWTNGGCSSPRRYMCEKKMNKTYVRK